MSFSANGPRDESRADGTNREAVDRPGDITLPWPLVILLTVLLVVAIGAAIWGAL